MATYKVLQDVEAEDKLVGPLSLRQFVYAAISAFLLYLSFFALTKNVGFLLIFFVPPALFTGFLAIPWHGDQPTEVWAIAKLRFMLKPRKRIWDQSGAKELVTITVPKKIERSLTNGLSQTEVRSRLHALADTIDSRGWAVKNINVNLSTGLRTDVATSDRLVDAMSLPQDVSSVDVRATDDMLDPSASPIAQHFDAMIQSAATTQRQQLLQQMQAPPTAQTTTQSPQNTPHNDYWFMHQPTPVAGQSTFNNVAVVAPGMTTASEPPAVTQAAAPTAEEEALIAQLKATNESHSAANDHLKHIKTSAELAEEQRLFAAQKAAEAAKKQQVERQKAQVTSEKEAAIMNLARNDDLDVATIARQAKKEVQNDDGEVVISLH